VVAVDVEAAERNVEENVEEKAKLDDLEHNNIQLDHNNIQLV